MLGFEVFETFLEGCEGAGDLGVIFADFEFERDCSLSLEEGEFKVVGEEEELGW